MDDINTNKQFRLYDATGKYTRLSVDETISRGHNLNWKGWQCSAGVRALYIDYDGNIWMCNSSGGNYQKDNFNTVEWEKHSHAVQAEIGQHQWDEKKYIYLKDFWKTEGAFVNKMFPNNQETRKTKTGYLGNISEGFTIGREWVTCPWSKCTCGADVILSKAKNTEYTDLLAITEDGYWGRELTKDQYMPTIGEPVAVEMNFPIPYQVLWDLGRRCNYDCHYCWPNVHNRHEAHKDYGDLIKTCDRIITDWSGGETIRWNFGGGEPTLHPQFLDLLEYLKGRNQWTMVTSNGTRDHRYWGKAVQHLNSINLSAHFDGLRDGDDESRFIKNIEVICRHFDEHDDDHWLEIKLMAPPQHFDRAISLRRRILDLGVIDTPGANGRIKGVLSMVPIRTIAGGGKLADYTPEQLEILQHQ